MDVIEKCRAKASNRTAIMLFALLIGGMLPLTTSSSDFDKTGPDGFHAIFWAVESLDSSEVKHYLDSGLSTEVRGFAGSTPALVAAHGNAWAICLLLLERGANPRAVSSTGLSIPWLASKSNISLGSNSNDALMSVRARLEALGLMDKVYEPAQVKKMLAEGMWPPQ
jgi:hypothetical protein